MYNEPFDIITESLYDKALEPTDRLKKDTLCFHTFMLMNIINMINCRVVNPNESNVFKTLLDNPLFIFIFMLEMIIQNGIVLVGAIEP